MNLEIRHAAGSMKPVLVTIFGLLLDLLRYVYIGLRTGEVPAAGNLFLRRTSGRIDETGVSSVLSHE